MDADQKFNLGRTIIVILAVLLAVYMTKDVLDPLLISFLLAYVFYPLYKWFLNRTHRKSVSSLLTTLLILCIVIIPIAGFVGALLQEISKLAGLGGVGYLQTQANILSDAFRGLAENYLPAQFADRLKATGDIGRAALDRIAPIIQDGLMNFASNVPLYATYVMVAPFFTFYFFTDGRGLIDWAKELLPSKEVTARFIKELDAIYSSLFRLVFVTAAITAVITAVGFAILGVPYPVLFGTLTGIVSLLPIVGPPLVFVPTAVYFIALQDHIRAIAVLFFGVVFIDLLPNQFIFPKLAQRGASIHPMITILAFTAPLLVVGVMGFIIGPVVYGFVLAAFRTWIYFREMKHGDDASVAPVKP
jgi:predicted PurR-regulated permease PerM